MGLVPGQVGFLSAHTAADSCVRTFGSIHFEMDHELGIPELYLREKGKTYVCSSLGKAARLPGRPRAVNNEACS